MTMQPKDRLLPTTLVGSYPQPDWLVDRAQLAALIPPRIRAREIWRRDARSLAGMYLL
jgi:5-methyltetrahydropteroyltriglutamate--homocysteine methyltransferase